MKTNNVCGSYLKCSALASIEATTNDKEKLTKI